MQFDTKVKQMLKEGLLEGQADYGDVMDAIKKLELKAQELAHIYPADRTSTVHASYKTEIDKTVARLQSWIDAQTKHTTATAKSAQSPSTSSKL